MCATKNEISTHGAHHANPPPRFLPPIPFGVGLLQLLLDYTYNSSFPKPRGVSPHMSYSRVEEVHVEEPHAMLYTKTGSPIIIPPVFVVRSAFFLIREVGCLCKCISILHGVSMEYPWRRKKKEGGKGESDRRAASRPSIRRADRSRRYPPCRCLVLCTL